MRTILQAAILVLVTVCIANLILEYGHRPREFEAANIIDPPPLPPMEIRQIAWAMDRGFDVEDAALDMLSRYIEEHQRSWDYWCELERRRADR